MRRKTEFGPSSCAIFWEIFWFPGLVSSHVHDHLRCLTFSVSQVLPAVFLVRDDVVEGIDLSTFHPKQTCGQQVGNLNCVFRLDLLNAEATERELIDLSGAGRFGWVVQVSQRAFGSDDVKQS
jgi:hypothetical protein